MFLSCFSDCSIMRCHTDSTLKCTNRWESEYCYNQHKCCIKCGGKLMHYYICKNESNKYGRRMCKHLDLFVQNLQFPLNYRLTYGLYICSVLDSVVSFIKHGRSAYIIMTDCCSCVFGQHQQLVSTSPATLLMDVNPWDVLVFCPQAEIVKRLNGICAQVLPYLSQEVRLCDLFMTHCL